MAVDVTARCYARAGLLGNPSDGYGGKTISLIVRNFWAEARLRPADRWLIERDPREQVGYESLLEIQELIRREGYYHSERLVKAACKQFADHFSSTLDLSGRPCSIAVTTNIPRQVGLAGSSAIVMAVFRGLLRWFDLEMDPAELATRVLWSEQRELGIPAGFQDRVIQAHEGLLFMDFSPTVMRLSNGLPCGDYQKLEPGWLPPLYIAFTKRDSEPTEVTHGSLRARFDAGDRQVVDAMRQFAELAVAGRAALLNRDWTTLDELINANFDLRRQVCDLHPHHLAMIEAARSVGVSAKYCGSGGAIIGTWRHHDQLEQLRRVLHPLTCEVIRPEI